MGPWAYLVLSIVGLAAALLLVRDWLAPTLLVLDLRSEPVATIGLVAALAGAQAIALAAVAL